MLRPDDPVNVFDVDCVTEGFLVKKCYAISSNVGYVRTPNSESRLPMVHAQHDFYYVGAITSAGVATALTAASVSAKHSHVSV